MARVSLSVAAHAAELSETLCVKHNNPNIPIHRKEFILIMLRSPLFKLTVISHLNS
jgi:hypothetical protein